MVLQIIKNMIKHTFLYDIIIQIWRKRDLRRWQKKGKPVPPPHLVKQRTVKEYARKFSIRNFVETGTFRGEMVNVTKNIFSKIFSIELDETLYEQAKKKFAKFAHISIIQGDSSEVLPDILAEITQPYLFWLDAHYSGGVTAKGNLETPIIQELRLIFSHALEEHVILIDDARLFVGRNDYPTLEELRNFVFEQRPGWVIEVENDIIRIHKKSTT